MRVINFLPDDYLQRRSVRRANAVCLLLGIGTILALGLVTGLTALRAISAAAECAAMEAQYREAGRKIDQLKQLEDRKSGLLHKVELSTTLLERVPRSHVLARLTNYLPPGTSLTVVTMRAEDVEVPADSVAAGTGTPAPPKPGVKPADPKGKPATVKVKRIKFRLDGLAKTDVDVAEYLRRLTGDPLFESVDLQFCEGSPYEEGVTMRRFQLSFQLSPKAEKIMETAAAPPAAAPARAKGES
jgi:hypothetical protein